MRKHRKDSHKHVAKYTERFDQSKIAEDEIDGKKVFVCATCGNPIERIKTTYRCKFCGTFLVG
ncbi:MAG: hypothetical protein IJ339_00330 [Oscillospiraceae bacterium]|nr:hypothetical protein [Oscillospiraceae bacterium]